MTRTQEATDTARALAEAAVDRKAERVVALDVSELTSFTDAFVIASGTSDRHVRAVADAVVERAAALGRQPLGVEGLEGGQWVLIDLDDVVIHVFQGETRDHYDLERLWADAPATWFEATPGGAVQRRSAP
ncbi:MAG TPA: ribosome silencing factor [Myxococcota bacterium]|nr:ribosome silencing factor [Myxococcota bacterium]